MLYQQFAVQQRHKLKRKLEWNAVLVERYRKTTKEYLDWYYARKLTIEEAIRSPGIMNYVRDHCVTSQSTPYKIRAVFNVGAKYYKTCLNGHLLKGPGLINNFLLI